MRRAANNATLAALRRGFRLLLAALVLGGASGGAALAQGQAPTVTVAISAPASGAVVTAPGTIALQAAASVNRQNWAILRVEFYSGAQLIGTATAAPHRYTWANVPAGSYTLTARAIATNAGQAKQDPATHPNMPTWEAVSAPVTIIVNAAPTVAITTSALNTVVNAPANITVSATAADSDGSVTKVEFYQGAALIGTATSAPYSISWTNVAAGSYSLTAVATDNRGASTTSAAVPIRVNAVPTVSVTSPADSATFTAPADIQLAANAADSDGTIAKVEFYHGSTLITTLTAAPYSVIWTRVPQGSYTLTAKATDNQGAESTSAAVTVTVNAAVASTLYYIHTDHLNTPRLITNEAQQPVWRWDNTDPFGGNPPNENPSGLGTFTCNLRLPGQYFDRETNTHYNYYRDYDPAIGRYVQSDPIGLRGGINTYLYAFNPLLQTDPMGLMGQGSGAGTWRGVPRAPSVRSDGQPWGWGCGDVASDRYVPDSIDGVSFIRACRNHDICYETCGANKPACDKKLFDDIVDDCFASGRGVGLCLLGARAYYAAMSTRASQGAFNKAQQKCGQCRP